MYRLNYGCPKSISNPKFMSIDCDSVSFKIIYKLSYCRSTLVIENVLGTVPMSRCGFETYGVQYNSLCSVICSFVQLSSVNVYNIELSFLEQLYL